MRARRWGGRWALAAGLLTAMLGSGSPVEADAGAVDPGFGSSGIVQTDIGLRDAQAELLVQPDGKTISIGTVDGRGVVVRHRTDGTLDPTFGVGGVVRLSAAATLQGGALQASDGKVVVVGTDASFDDLLVARFLPSGAPDPAFGNSGVVETDFGSAENGSAVAVQVDGKLVAVGRSGDRVALVRYLANGTPDPGFGSGGPTTTSFTPAGTSAEVPSALRRSWAPPAASPSRRTSPSPSTVPAGSRAP